MTESEVREVLELRQRLEEVRRRAIVDFHTGTALNAPHWGSCRICGWLWRYGEPELHEPTCPMKEIP